MEHVLILSSTFLLRSLLNSLDFSNRPELPLLVALWIPSADGALLAVPLCACAIMVSPTSLLLLLSTFALAAPPSPQGAGFTEPDPALQVSVELNGKSFINKVLSSFHSLSVIDNCTGRASLLLALFVQTSQNRLVHILS